MNQIYLDYNASSPIAPEVVEAMKPFLSRHYGNPSSSHWAGRPAKEAVESARSRVANRLNASPGEIVFTSGGSESNNHAIKGTFYALRNSGNHIVTTEIEHPSVLESCRFIEQIGGEVTRVGVDEYGRVDPEDVRKAMRPDTVLISVMHANNEVGTVQPIPEIASVADTHDVVFHTDAAQSVGKIATDVEDLGVDLLTVAGHKLYGPKGVGALYIRDGTEIESLVHGAGHEGGRRAGTENVLLDVGLGKACEISTEWTGMPGVREIRDLFWERLQDAFGDDVVLNGHPTYRLPNTLNVSFVNRSGSEVLASLDGVAASTGSACHEGSVELSPVLDAMGVSEEVGMGAVRFSLGQWTTQDEVKRVANMLEEQWTE